MTSSTRVGKRRFIAATPHHRIVEESEKCSNWWYLLLGKLLDEAIETSHVHHPFWLSLGTPLHLRQSLINLQLFQPVNGSPLDQISNLFYLICSFVRLGLDEW